MKINSNGVNSAEITNQDIKKGKKQSFQGEEKKIDAESSAVLESYGRALLHKPKSEKEKILAQIEFIRQRLLEEFPQDDERAKQFIQSYNSSLDELKQSAENNTEITEWDLRCLSDYAIESSKALFDLKDDGGEYFLMPNFILFGVQSITPGTDIESIKQYLSAKDDSGKYVFCNNNRFNPNTLNDLHYLNNQNISVATKLVKIKSPEGYYFYPGRNFGKLLSLVNPKTEDFINELCDMKDSNGVARIVGDVDSLSELLDVISPENIDYARQLLPHKSKDGRFTFDFDGIAKTLPLIKKDNETVLNAILSRKNDSSLRVDSRLNAVQCILYNLTDANKEYVLELINLENSESGYQFSISDLAQITAALKEENIEHIKTLLSKKDDDGKPLLDGKYSVLRLVNKDNIDVLEKLSTINDESGKAFVENYGAEEFIKNLAPENIPFLLRLTDIVDSDGNYRFDVYKTSELLSVKNANNADFILKLASMNDGNGKFLFSAYAIKDIAEVVPPESIDTILELASMTNSDGTPKFDTYDLAGICKAINKNNENIALQLALRDNSDDSDIYFISTICSLVNENNKELIQKIISMEDDNGDYRFSLIQLVQILEDMKNCPADFILNVINTKDSDGNYKFSIEDLALISRVTGPENVDYISSLVDMYNIGEITPTMFSAMLEEYENISYSDIKTLEHLIGKETVRSFDAPELITAAKFKDILWKENINEIPIIKKKDVLKGLVSSNVELFDFDENFRKYFPMLPRTQEEYCSLLPAIVKSLGIETNQLSDSEISTINENISSLANTLSAMSDGEFTALRIKQEYSTDQFIKDTFEILKDVTPQERQKVYDYFGFELHHNSDGTQVDNNPKHSFGISGYPVNLNNGKKLAQITNPQTKQIVEQLRPYVVKYSENNRIVSNNQSIEKMLNEIIQAFPELRTQIGKEQHKTQDFDLFKHSLKVMQKIAQNPEFEKLSDSDKQVLLLASIFHDITKAEGKTDKSHPYQSAFDTYYILKKMKLPHDTESKIYSLINSHEWFSYVNNKKVKNTEKRMQSVAFDLQYDNLFDLAKIFTKADTKAVKSNDSFFNKYAKDFETATKQIEANIIELKKSKPLLPVTQLPTADTIDKAITKVNSDYSTNIKGVYKDENGLIILKFNEIEDWEAIGFPKGSVSKGIKVQANETLSENVNTGNIKFFVHALDFSNQLAKFDAFALPDSNALLSVSYTERPESKYRFFRPQGVILNTDTKYIHGGGQTDAGSGYGKNIQTFKDQYIFGGERESDRKFISDLIKDALCINDEEYVEFVKENANKSFNEIEPEEVRNKIIKAFSTINSHKRRGNRAYNEMYISNPNVMGVFAYSAEDDVGNVSTFMKDQKDFLKQYAIEKNIPFVIFGD